MAKLRNIKKSFQVNVMKCYLFYITLWHQKRNDVEYKNFQDANVLIDIGYGSYRFRYSHMPIFANGVGPSSYHAVVRVIYGNEQTAVWLCPCWI